MSEHHWNYNVYNTTKCTVCGLSKSYYDWRQELGLITDCLDLREREPTMTTPNFDIAFDDEEVPLVGGFFPVRRTRLRREPRAEITNPLSKEVAETLKTKPVVEEETMKEHRREEITKLKKQVIAQTKVLNELLPNIRRIDDIFKQALHDMDRNGFDDVYSIGMMAKELGEIKKSVEKNIPKEAIEI
jgi:hypothetical protein